MMTLWMVIFHEASELNAMKYVNMRNAVSLSMVSLGLSSAVLENSRLKPGKHGRMRVLGDSFALRSLSSACKPED